MTTVKGAASKRELETNKYFVPLWKSILFTVPRRQSYYREAHFQRLWCTWRLQLVVSRRRVASSECRSSPRSSPPLSWTPWIARRTSRSRVSTWGAPRDYTLCRAAAIDEVLVVVVVVGLEAAPVRVVAEFPIGAITPTPFSL